ncbi:hypothetical protein [Bremerella cremea]|uniref:hypothetical protein n=1 Tax=Bremerella cremea TaxID=1031537 RepID=UPI0031F17C14
MIAEIYDANRPLFKLPASHPARQFLEAFVACRQACSGRELPPPLGEAIDQTWWSKLDQRQWTFSGFVYMYVSFTVVLDGWLTDATERTETERLTLEKLPHLEQLLSECRAACHAHGNFRVLAMVDQVGNMLTLWRDCLVSRRDS